MLSRRFNSDRTQGEEYMAKTILSSSPVFLKILIAIMVLLIIQLQYRLWFGDGSIAQIKIYQQRLDDLKKKVEEKKQRNEALNAEIIDLKKGQEAIEERAREELGMIKENETFFQVLE
jgi:cell division protein FtsB